MEEQAKVLIVDDELGPRESLRMILKPMYQIYTADNGQKAIGILQENPAIDVVTLDLKMPGLPGYEVLREIKNYNSDIEVIIVTGYGSLRSAVDGIRYGVFDYITKPFNTAEIISVISRAVNRRRLYSRLKGFLEDLGKFVGYNKDVDELTTDLGDNNFLNTVRKLFQNHVREQQKDDINHIEFVRVLAAALENKEPYTNGHSTRVNYYSNLIAQKMPLSRAEINELHIASFLHDIGKIGISNEYLFKEEKLLDKEVRILREHPEKGAIVVGPLNLSPRIVSAIRHHHERYDGKGYPDGLKGEGIPLFARILAIADAFDAMSTDRPYRKRLSTEAITSEFQKCAGTQFDPMLVGLFLSLYEKGEGLWPDSDFTR